ncbi:four helix bundle suffix domain-containing protein [Candidatus Shapirobacteria bacterium]|nr:four helix bundle suffix domain-containing protein [Candidatus Shapirobacteria bacterium]
MNKVKYLLSYRYAEMIHDLTMDFVENNIDYKSRTRDQMEQAARSGKQNIVEGVGQEQTSKKGLIKLLGVAKASFEELLMDYEDFLRQKGLNLYQKTDPRVTKFRQFAYELSNLRNLGNLGNLIKRPKLTGKPEVDANFLLTLCHQVTFLLDRQIKVEIEKFAQEGGLTEKLYSIRKNYLENK